MSIVWSPDLNTGIEVIDQQHMRIVDFINDLEAAQVLGDKNKIKAVIDDCVDYTLSHFAFEESLQEEAGYQYAKPHKAVHEVFIKRVAKFQEKHDAGEDVAPQLHAMLSTWLVHHIKRDDMAYVKEVNTSINRIVENKKEGNWLSRSLGRFFK